MLARAPALPTGWVLRVGDALRTGLPDASASLVTCAWLLHLLAPTDQFAVLTELRRLLAPEGRAVLIVPTGATPRGMARVAAPVARFLADRRGLPVLRPVPGLDAALREVMLRTVAETTTIEGWPARVLLVRADHAVTPATEQAGE